MPGYYAVESLRLEKGYRAWGRELTPDDTPFQAGLGWAVKLDKPGGFIGQKALVEAKAKPLARRLVSVVLEDREPLLWGGETLLRDGKPVGDLTLGRLRPHDRRLGRAWAMSGARTAVRHRCGVAGRRAKFEVDLAGTRLRRKVSLRCPYDPTGARIKA